MSVHKNIIVKKIPADGTFGDIDSKLKTINSNDISIIAFKVGIDIIVHLKSDSKDREQILNRINEDANFYLLNTDSIDFTINIYQVTIDDCILIEDQNILHEIRDADFQTILLESDGHCFHICDDKMHYQTPSGMHTKAFLRLADAIHSFGRLDRISYWLLPSIQSADAVLIDNWSLASIILHSQSTLGHRVKFDCLHQHLSTNVDDARKVISNLVGEMPQNSKVLILVSVNASGDHLSSLLKMCAQVNQDIEYISASIYQMPYHKVSLKADTTFCELIDEAMNSYQKNDCPYCIDNEEFLTIDDKYYYPRQSKENPVLLPATYVEKGNDNRTHLDILGKDYGVFCVHRDDPNDEEVPRHHAFYVDVSKLADNNEFVTLYKETMQLIESEHGIPDVVVYPPHPAAQKLIGIIKSKWDCQFIASSNLRDIDDEKLEILRSSRHICIADDVIISGSRIARYVRTFREQLKLDTNTFKQLSVFISVQRPESSECISKLKGNALSAKNSWNSTLYSTTSFHLPNWEKDQCPWCKEATIWNEAPRPFDPPIYYKSRMLALDSRTTTGISAQAIPRFEIDNTITIGTSSPLADSGSSEMHVLFVVASLLQEMRNDPDPKKKLAKTFYTNNALGVTNTILPCGEKKNVLERYSEPLLQACLLRCSKTSEWSSEMLTVGIPKLISTIKCNDEHILLLEILFYLKRMVYKQQELHTLRAIFSSLNLEDDDPATALLETLSK